MDDNLPAVRALLEHPAYIATNPNCNYSVLRAFAVSSINFHKADGSGYKFLAEEVAKVQSLVMLIFTTLCCFLQLWYGVVSLSFPGVECLSTTDSL